MDKERQYDAFISYKHQELDSLVAMRLHRMLEHYRIPGKIQATSGKKRIHRIFRDMDELTPTNDLTENIRQALQNAEYLLLICSKESCRSEWVQKEVEEFLKTHDKNRIILILLEGEPGEVFPEQLRYVEKTAKDEDGIEHLVKVPVEPLAADIRGRSETEIIRNLKKELLRIIAPIVSCSYDDLRQRHREYMLKRAGAIAGIIFCLLLAFALYALHQESKVKEQYEKAMVNQARYLSKTSGELLASGDRVGALKTAVEALSKENENGPLAPEAMYALNNALYSYQYTNTADLSPDQIMETEYGTGEQGGLSPDENYYLAIDEGGEAYVFDVESGKCLWKTEPQEKDVVKNGCFVTENRIAMATESKVYVADIKSGETLWEKRLSKEFSGYEDGQCVSNGKQLAVCEATWVSVYDAVDGTILLEQELEEAKERGLGRLNAAVINEAGTLLALGETRNKFETDDNADKFCGLYLLSLEDGDVQMMEAKDAKELCFLDDRHLAALQYEMLGDSEYFEAENRYKVAVYDCDIGKSIRSVEGMVDFSRESASGMCPKRIKLDGAGRDVLAVTLNSMILLLDTDTFEEILKVQYPDEIAGWGLYDATRMMVGLHNGAIILQSLQDPNIQYDSGKLNAKVHAFAYSAGSRAAIQVRQNDTKIVLSRIQRDEEIQYLDAEGNLSFVGYCSLNDKAYRGLFYNSYEEEALSRLDVWEAGTSNLLISVSVKTKLDTFMHWFAIAGTDESPILYYIEDKKVKSGDAVLHAVDINRQKELYQKPVPCGIFDSVAAYGDAEDPRLAVCYDDKFGIIRLKDGKQVLKYKDEIKNGRIEEVVAAPDGSCLIFKVADGDEAYIKLWDVKEKDWKEIEGKESYRYGGSLKARHVAIGKKNALIAVYSTEEKEIKIIDLASGRIQKKIPFRGSDSPQFEFWGNDEHLILYDDSRCLAMWNIEKEKMEMQDTEQIRSISGIYTDQSSKYFGVQEDMVQDNGFKTTLHLYFVDDHAKFYRYADVDDGAACIQAEEILCMSAGKQVGYYSFYSYPELMKKAEEILDGRKLTEEERRKYFADN